MDRLQRVLLLAATWLHRTSWITHLPGIGNLLRG
jgi:hypothetical protein